MKRIIAVFDGLDFSTSTLEYALFFAKQKDMELVGVFLDDFTYNSYRLAEVVNEEGALSEKLIGLKANEDRQTRDWAAQEFEEACIDAGVKYKVHRDKNIALQELLHESIYADVLIIDKKETFSIFEKQTPANFLRELLVDVQCPVLVVPGKFRKIENIIFLYDGEPSSVFAIKMFSHTFPSLNEKNVEVLIVKSKSETLHVPNGKLMREFMKRRYPEAEFIIEKGDAEDNIVSYLKNKKQPYLAVLGAYRRSRVSRWFRPSMADRLISELDIPLFIAHNK